MRLLTYLLLSLFINNFIVSAQNYYSPDISVIENYGESPLLLVTVASFDTNDMENLAMTATLNNYLFKGIPGVGSGQPLLNESERNAHYEFFRRIFSNKSKYGIYVTEVRRKGKLYTNDSGQKECQYIVRFSKNTFDHALANEGIIYQRGGNGKSQGPKPSIMIIPFENLDGDVEQILRQSPHLRNAITAAQGIFRDNGYNVVDFFALHDARKNDRNYGINNTNSYIKSLIQSSGADIYVTLDGTPVNSGGNNLWIDLAIKAYYRANGVILAGKTTSASSNRGLIDLYSKAIYNCGDDFMDSINKSFQNLNKGGSGPGGQYISLVVEVDKNATMDLDTEIGSDLYTLGDYITEYIKINTREAKPMGLESHIIQFESIILPDSDKNGSRVGITDFATALTRFLRSKGVKCKRIIEGTTIRINITG